MTMRLRTLLGDHSGTLALKDGSLAETAIVTYLMARSYVASQRRAARGCAAQQRLIPRAFAVDELFGDLTRTFGAVA